MRLICPNCDAQYEVDDDVIPEGGRDVQCSNCGHAWFQRPAHQDADLADDLDEVPPAEDATFDEGDPEEPEPDVKEAGDTGDPKPDDAPERRKLDPNIASVLREEAEREAKARKADSEGLETQPDLGLDDTGEVAAQRSAAARARMARLRGIDDGSEPDPAAAAAAAGSRREMLPDIDEINSTLRASDDRESDSGDSGAGRSADETTRTRRGGARTGFLLVVLLAVIAAGVYALAPQIIAQVPQAEPYLATYVEWVNNLRGQLDAGLETAVARISELIAGLTGGEG